MKYSQSLRSRVASRWPKAFQPLPVPQLAKEVIPMRSISTPLLRPEDISFFKENGYFTSQELLDGRGIATLRTAVESVFSGNIDTNASPYEYKDWLVAVETCAEQGYFTRSANDSSTARKVLKVNNSWWINRQIRALLIDPASPAANPQPSHFAMTIGRMAADLLGVNEIRLWHDQVIVKPPGKGDQGNVGWHQDYAYWQLSSSSQMITALIMLQDTSAHNGALQTVEKSHHWGLVYDEGDPGFFNPDLMGLQEKFCQLAEGRPWSVVTNAVGGGQITFHHSLTFHGSGPNHSHVPRLAIAIHMQSEQCRLRHGRGNHHNLRDLGPFANVGDRFDISSCPVLFRR